MQVRVMSLGGVCKNLATQLSCRNSYSFVLFLASYLAVVLNVRRVHFRRPRALGSRAWRPASTCAAQRLHETTQTPLASRLSGDFSAPAAQDAGSCTAMTPRLRGTMWARLLGPAAR